MYTLIDHNREEQRYESGNDQNVAYFDLGKNQLKQH